MNTIWTNKDTQLRSNVINYIDTEIKKFGLFKGKTHTLRVDNNVTVIYNNDTYWKEVEFINYASSSYSTTFLCKLADELSYTIEIIDSVSSI
jgi:hypothetical protein